MNSFKILLVEDDENYQSRFKESIEVFKKQYKTLDVKYDIKENVRDVANIEDVSYDGVIIDLHLEGNDQGGNEIVENLHDEFSRIPRLPETDFFEGGVLNFRKLTTWHKDEFDQKFGKLTIQISPFFIKDIVSRFSSYYARQGQPEIDSKDFIDRYTS